MSSPTYWFIKLMISFVLLCTFIRTSSTQPLFVDDDEDLTQVDHSFLNNNAAAYGRLAGSNPYRFNIPENFNNYRQQQQQQHLFSLSKQYNPDHVQLAKRIIMLPRVGRRSIQSTFHQ